jgi:hypothetical protein
VRQPSACGQTRGSDWKSRSSGRSVAKKSAPE